MSGGYRCGIRMHRNGAVSVRTDQPFERVFFFFLQDLVNLNEKQLLIG